MMNNCRVLDLTDEKGFLCGKILGDLGADVIKIEPPGGDPSRNIGSFYHDIPDPEKNLYWFAYNSNKRGVTLNLKESDGRELFRKLIESADIVVESFKPGYMDGLGIGYSDMKKMKEAIIWASITPFGLEGPYRDYKDSDLVVMGMTGTMYQTGERDEAPLHISMPQASLHAGADAAVGCLMAYYHRKKTGKGQLVDVSLQQSAGWFQANAIPMYELNGGILKRAGAFRTGMSKDVGQRQVWPCKDSYVFFNVIGGKQGAKLLRSLTEWMDTEGMATEYLLGKDWDNFDMFSVSREEMTEIQEAIGAFFKIHTSKELMAGAVPRQISIGPLSSMKDLINDEGLNGRGFWKDIEHPELGVTLPYPRQFVQSSEEDFSTRFRAPLIGEHNKEIYSGLGLSDNEMIILKQAGII